MFCAMDHCLCSDGVVCCSCRYYYYYYYYHRHHNHHPSEFVAVAIFDSFPQTPMAGVMLIFFNILICALCMSKEIRLHPVYVTDGFLGSKSWPSCTDVIDFRVVTRNLGVPTVFQVSLSSRTDGLEGGVRGIALLFFLTSALDGGGWSSPPPGCRVPRKESGYPLYRRLVGLQDRSVRVRKM